MTPYQLALQQGGFYDGSFKGAQFLPGGKSGGIPGFLKGKGPEFGKGAGGCISVCRSSGRFTEFTDSANDCVHSYHDVAADTLELSVASPTPQKNCDVSCEPPSVRSVSDLPFLNIL